MELALNPAQAELTPHLIRELRSDHAGETGAVYIYQGIITIAQIYRNQELVTFAKHHLKTEEEHLQLVEEWLESSNRSRLLGPWRMAGWLTGAIPALFGSKSVYATIAAVETFVDRHYQEQIDHMQSVGGPKELLSLLQRCQADEQHHRDEAKDLIQSNPPGLVLAAWCMVVGIGSKLAVSLARRI
ncbi:demethoxyubiquinone hydroxylase family protein [Polynucleobacter acidiphobus]|uniref:demethoxyubiquinone hydroxylase family protein n=1 Tax=Polynucleobacter acidiphobus TaxID=556053 RepID=UPI000D3A7F7A|nr:demethoxyubiquinone hydroxylase family protein [Polynucleobacter acidiphobus]